MATPGDVLGVLVGRRAIEGAQAQQMALEVQGAALVLSAVDLPSLGREGAGLVGWHRTAIGILSVKPQESDEHGGQTLTFTPSYITVSTVRQQDHPERLCEQCNRRMTVDPRATHKRFCSAQCKRDFWNEARAQGARAIRERGAA